MWILNLPRSWSCSPVDLARHRTALIVGLSVLAGLAATWVMPQLTPPDMLFDYNVYMQGARIVRAGQDPYTSLALSFWYPLPIVLFTLVPWSFLPNQFVWAFAFIPLGLLFLRYGRRAVWWWLFFPLLINVIYAQAEGWLILPLIWLLEDIPTKASLGMIALMFKPAYGMFLAPYRVWCWLRVRRWRELSLLLVLTLITFGAAFWVDPSWPVHWLAAISHRNGLVFRDMTAWAFLTRRPGWLVVLGLMLVALAWLVIPMVRVEKTRGQALVALSLFFFPGGLYPVSTMMMIPLAETTAEIVTLVVVSWLVALLDYLVDFAGVYLLIVLVALALRRRHYG